MHLIDPHGLLRGRSKNVLRCAIHSGRFLTGPTQAPEHHTWIAVATRWQILLRLNRTEEGKLGERGRNSIGWVNLDADTLAPQRPCFDLTYTPRIRSGRFACNLFPFAVCRLDLRDEPVACLLRKRELQTVALQNSLRIDRYPWIGISGLRAPKGGWISVVDKTRGMIGDA